MNILLSDFSKSPLEYLARSITSLRKFGEFQNVMGPDQRACNTEYLVKVVVSCGVAV